MEPQQEKEFYIDLKQIENNINFSKKQIDNMQVSLRFLQHMVDLDHRLLDLIEQDHGKHETIDHLRRELDELIELRKGKGNWEKGQETSPSFQKVFTELIERGRDYPLRKNPPGFIID